VHGIGGQGVKLLSETLAYILSDIGKNLTLVYEYDSIMRGGSITAFLVYGEEEIINPMIDEADYLIVLSKTTQFKGKTKIIEQTIYGEGRETTEIKIPLNSIAEELGNEKLVNMVTLGYLLKILKIDIKKLDLKKALPEKLLEENLKAIQSGYAYEERSEL